MDWPLWLSLQKLYLRIFQYYQALGLSLLNLDRFEELNKLIQEIENTSNSNFTHQGRYLSLLLDYKNENYLKEIGYREVYWKKFDIEIDPQ